jgi:hypothetical protein
MPVDAELPKLYRAPFNIWVEDALTSEYLQEVWHDPRLLFLIAGSSDSIDSAVSSARASGLGNVFGIKDRDFEAENSARWNNRDLHVFIHPLHEAENLLLDEEALAACDVNNRGRTAAEIRERMQSRAASLLLWMTACQVIKRVRRTCLDDFLDRPRPAQLADLSAVFRWIVDAPWHRGFAERARQILDLAILEQWIAEAHAAFVADIASGAWKESFSGKEILRDIRGFIYEPPPSQRAPPSEYDLDLAKSVGRWQAENRRVPPILGTLLEHIVAPL